MDQRSCIWETAAISVLLCKVKAQFPRRYETRRTVKKSTSVLRRSGKGERLPLSCLPYILRSIIKSFNGFYCIRSGVQCHCSGRRRSNRLLPEFRKPGRLFQYNLYAAAAGYGKLQCGRPAKPGDGRRPHRTSSLSAGGRGFPSSLPASGFQPVVSFNCCTGKGGQYRRQRLLFSTYLFAFACVAVVLLLVYTLWKLRSDSRRSLKESPTWTASPAAIPL